MYQNFLACNNLHGPDDGLKIETFAVCMHRTRLLEECMLVFFMHVN